MPDLTAVPPTSSAQKKLPNRRLETGSESVSGVRAWPDRESLKTENPRRSEGLAEADDGTRTHDLLHGKQTL